MTSASEMVPQRIHGFLTENAPAGFCDDCLKGQLELANRQQVWPVTTTLGLTSDFDKTVGVCSGCGKDTKLVKSRRWPGHR